MQITPGLRLGPYRILKLLGSGGMGSVYLAYDERLERHVALKMLTRDAREDVPRQILREARAAARLNHTNIASLYDVFEHEHEAFLVMEYVDGEPLTTLVKSQPVSVDRVLDIGLQLVEALRYAHSAGIIHRDVKPANVMVTRAGKVKVLDLGLARATPDPGADTRSESQSEIVPSRAGTPAYMAPERLGSHVADARTDVYSIGVVLFELLTGRRPYLAPDLMALAVNVATQPTPRVSQTRPDIPAPLDEVVARAMAKEPSTRYASAAELHDALVDVRETMSGRFKPPPVDWRTGWQKGALIGLGVVAAFAIGLWLWLGGAPPTVPATGLCSVAIPPVSNASTGQGDVDELGSLLQSIMSRNFAVLPEITIVPTPAPPSSGQTPAGQSSAPVPDKLSVTVRRMVAGFAADADFVRCGDTRAVRRQFTGSDEVALLSSVLNGLVVLFQQRLPPDRRIAESERSQLLELPTKDREALVSYLRGRTLLGASDDLKTDEAAVAAFQEAIKRDGSFAFAYAGLSQAYWSAWKHSGFAPSWLDQAWDAATHAAAIDPGCDQARVALALALRARNRKQEAVAEGTRAVGLTPDNDDARRTLGLALLDNKQTDAGLTELRAAVAGRPHRAVNQYYLGWGFIAAGRYQEAIAPLKQATELQRNFESAWANLGFAYLQVGDLEKSIGSTSRALVLNKSDSTAVNNLATAYYWDGKYALAVQRFQEAAALDPESVKRRMNLGDALHAVGRVAEARHAYAKAVELAKIHMSRNGFDAQTAGMMAKSQAKLERQADAEQSAMQAFTASETDREVVYKVAAVYALTGQSEKALDKLELAVKLGKALWEVRADPDLKSLRADPRFKKLVAQGGR